MFHSSCSIPVFTLVQAEFDNCEFVDNVALNGGGAVALQARRHAVLPCSTACSAAAAGCRRRLAPTVSGCCPIEALTLSHFHRLHARTHSPLPA